MKLNKQGTTLLILAMGIIVLILLSIFNNNHTVDTSEVLIPQPWEKDIRIINSDYMKHYLYSITGFYKELPWAVRTSYTIIQFSSLALLVLLYTLFWDVHNRKKRQKTYTELKNTYFEKLQSIIISTQEKHIQEIKSELSIDDNTEFTYSQKLALIDLFLELRTLITINEYSIKNIQNALIAFSLQQFMEERLLSGKESEKQKIIQAIRLLHMEVTDSYVARIINHRDRNLQKAARLYYILSNEEDPFKYMEGKKTAEVFLPWDMLETHQIFEDCKNLNKKLPSFIPAMTQMNNNTIIEFFIKETAYWGSEKEMNYLFGYLESPEESLRKAALESMNLRKIKHAEQKLKEIYYEQPENIKRVILYTLLVISPTTSIDFFKEAFENTASQLTKRMALQCLWKSDDNGRNTFAQMKENSRINDKILFLHVENKIIEREKLSLHSIN